MGVACHKSCTYIDAISCKNLKLVASKAILSYSFTSMLV